MYSYTNLFTEYLRPHYNDAVKYCRALTYRTSKDDAEDLFQQSVLKALENFDRLKDKEKFKSWFFTIITREHITLIRKLFWRKFIPLDDNENLSYSRMPEIFSEIESNERSALLQTALSKLNSKERSALLLFELADFSLEEIKEIQQEKSLSAVKSRLSRARAKLKEQIIKIESTQEVSFRKSNVNNLGELENETLKLVSEFKSK